MPGYTHHTADVHKRHDAWNTRRRSQTMHDYVYKKLISR